MANGPLERIVRGAQQLSQFREQQRLAPLRRESAELSLRGQELGVQGQEAQNQAFVDRMRRSDMARAAAEFLTIPETDTAGQDAFLNRRIADLQARGIDTQDTAGMLQLDPASRRQAAQATLQIAQQFGDAPATPQPKLTAPIRGRDPVTGEERFFDRDPQTGRLVPTAGAVPPASRPGVQVTVGGASEKAFGQEVGKIAAQDLFTKRQAAQGAVDSLESISKSKRLLNQGLITGFGANFKVGLGKALQEVGINFAQDEIANTEAFAANAAKQVAQIIKAFGAGTGLSDADREFATKAAAGDITLTEKSMRRIIDINEQAARNVIRRFNEQAAQIDPSTVPFELGITAPPTSEEALVIRFNELIAEGKSPQEAGAILKQEGFE